MNGKRRRFSRAFKANVALATVHGDRTTAELATKFGVHGNQVSAAWKRRLLTHEFARCCRKLLTSGSRLRAQDTPSLVASVKPARDIPMQDHAVVHVMAQLQRCPSPPSVSASRNSRKFVQPPARRTNANCGRSTSPPQEKPIRAGGAWSLFPGSTAGKISVPSAADFTS